MPFDPGTPLQVQEVSPRKWLLLGDLTYHGKLRAFTVPAGSKTDFASVPRLFTWLVPTSGIYTKAAVLHDYLCDTGLVPRNDADGIFRRAMRELGVPTVRRYVMWGAVRIASGLSGARLGDVIGIFLLALLVLPIALPVTLLVLAVLCILWVGEVAVWAVLTGLRQSPPSPKRFWWT